MTTIQITETLSITTTEDAVIVNGPRTPENVAAYHAYTAKRQADRSQELFDAKLAAHADAFVEQDLELRAQKMADARAMIIPKSRKEEFAEAVSKLPFVSPVGLKRKFYKK